jgi:hypothetical protein
MTLFPIDWLGSMFLFCSHGVKPSFQAGIFLPISTRRHSGMRRQAQAMVRNCAPENPFLPATSAAPWIPAE